MKNLITTFSLLFVALITFTSCNSAGTLLSPQDFNAQISGNNVQILDVRTPGEFNPEHIEGAVNIDVNGADFEGEIEKLDATKPVYVYCLSGGRSSTAAKILKAKGFKEIYELDGGMLAWSKANLPVKSVKPEPAAVQTNSVEQNFARSIANDTLTLVDFFAYWCGPCMKMKPSIEKLEKELSDVVEILSIDVDKEGKLAQQYNITAMPTLAFFKGNKEVHRVVGFQTEKQLRKLIAEYK